jgi:3-methyl-2-oxobutanoate hydroxymethyltransferase
MLTGYDASFAALLERCGVDVILVGDSLGNVLQGQKTTLPVSMEHMVYHTECVARGCSRPLIVTDMPFGSYAESPTQAMRNAARLMAAGAQMVKLEGGAFMAETVRFPGRAWRARMRPHRADPPIGAPVGRLPRPGPQRCRGRHPQDRCAGP